VVTKDQPTESNTGYAQGGVAVAMAVDDATDLHLDDTLKAGAGLVSEAAARVLVEEGPERIRELASWGARFDREAGRLHFTREGAHSRNRVLHALGDATGWEMVRSLLDRTQRTPAIRVSSFSCSIDLVMSDGRVTGCRFLDEDGNATEVLARATLLATGGAGQVFAETTNPPVATGDGVAMAWRAGAALHDMEFTQFHPTALAIDGAPRFLVSEAVRGEGAYLRNAGGDRFTEELAARDQVARAIAREVKAGRGPVTLDLRHLDPERVRTRFPRIQAMCARYGIEITTDPIPVTPAAHYVMGGVATDLHGRCTTAWPATRSSKGSSSAPARRRPWPRTPFPSPPPTPLPSPPRPLRRGSPVRAPSSAGGTGTRSASSARVTRCARTLPGSTTFAGVSRRPRTA
jgi:L-aspartate oxidase